MIIQFSSLPFYLFLPHHTHTYTHLPSLPKSTSQQHCQRDFNKHSTLLHIGRIVRESGKSCLIRKNLSFHRRRHRRNLRQELAIHIAHVIGSVHRRLERRHDLLPHQLLPVDVRKPGMIHDVIDVVSEARFGLSVEQTAAQIESVKSRTRQSQKDISADM